jgi:2-polyprenyl-3-methyl-5-hydroxy-6-metoxy-1,4-benzoquinol methylase
VGGGKIEGESDMNRGRNRSKLWHEVDDLEEAKEYIDSSYTTYFGPNSEVVNRCVGPDVLDFGGGVGRNVPPLVEAGCNVYVYDFPNMVKLGKKYLGELGERVQWLEAGSVDLGDYRFNTVMASLVFQHMTPFEVSLVLKVLKAEKLVVFSRGYFDVGGCVWPVLLKFCEPLSYLNPELCDEAHQVVEFVWK